MKKIGFGRLAAASLILATLFVSAVQAQIVLEEIVVTATKRTENIQDVPISMSVISEEQMNSVRAGG